MPCRYAQPEGCMESLARIVSNSGLRPCNSVARTTQRASFRALSRFGLELQSVPGTGPPAGESLPGMQFQVFR